MKVTVSSSWPPSRELLSPNFSDRDTVLDLGIQVVLVVLVVMLLLLVLPRRTYRYRRFWKV